MANYYNHTKEPFDSLMQNIQGNQGISLGLYDLMVNKANETKRENKSEIGMARQITMSVYIFEKRENKRQISYVQTFSYKSVFNKK